MKLDLNVIVVFKMDPTNKDHFAKPTYTLGSMIGTFKQHLRGSQHVWKNVTNVTVINAFNESVELFLF